ncbi:dTDP-4-dehydrorhamnose reductase [uncultured Devosia sp.]|uniref:dTDP-4-dehydrorhamnose reductase n=1 Tax=uncultured Devosia sp. TaxID=211434 RepID=UPI0035CB9755
MRIALTGRNGQVASALLALAPGEGHTIVCMARPECNLSDPSSIAPALAAAAPDIVVSAAAYTEVDRAEAEPALAHAVNAVAPGILATATSTLGIPLIHLSTDYVFDGSARRPYVEADTPNPQNVYGASKLAGEMAIAEATDDAVILRTAWLHSPTGNNFVRTMLRLARTRSSIGVVCDQFGCPTAAEDVAAAILAIARRLLANSDTGLRGIFHMAGTGQASWADLAVRTFADSASLGGPWAEVQPLASANYPTAAIRPANAVLATAKLALAYGIVLPDWQTSLRRTVRSVAVSEGWRSNILHQNVSEAVL